MKANFTKMGLSLAVAGVLVAVAAGPAAATYSTYYHGATVKYSQHNSAVSNGVWGGSVLSNINTANFYLHTLTWSGYGAGYTEYGRSAGTSPGPVYHYNSGSYNSVQNGCSWSIPGVTGSITLTCQISK